MSGVSTRTLRYYDQLGLLTPARVASNGYRIYGQFEIDLLQQILFYRELGVALEEIGQILRAPGYDPEKALTGHLSSLKHKKHQIELLIANVEKTIGALKGETMMNDHEKFEGFKQKLIDDNEKMYGDEIRERYGKDAVEASTRQVKGMSEEVWQESQRMSALISETLLKGFNEGDPAGETAQRACDLHRQWLCMFWEDGSYSKEAHLGLAHMYCDDERFKKHYEAITPGAAEFLLSAMKVYCAE